MIALKGKVYYRSKHENQAPENPGCPLCQANTGRHVFSEIEALVVAVDGVVREGDGSRIVFEIKGKREYLHRPHPGKEAKKYQVEAIRTFLQLLEITP